MHPRNLLPASAAALSCAVPASAGFVGWAAASRIDGTTVLVDVVANFDAASDRVLNVYDTGIGVSGATFIQDPALSRKAWAPAAGQTGDERDSFMTIGGTDGLFALSGSGTGGDPSFTGTPGAWTPTLLSTPSTMVPPNAGWYASDPASAEIVAMDLDSAPGRDWQNRAGRYGVWVAHFAFDLAALAPGASVTFAGQVGYKATVGPGGPMFGGGSAQFTIIPAPGAVALLAAAGLVGARARARR
jgi:hypothetical protein